MSCGHKFFIATKWFIEFFIAIRRRKLKEHKKTLLIKGTRAWVHEPAVFDQVNKILKNKNAAKTKDLNM